MSKKPTVTFPEVGNDFFKTNGVDTRIFDPTPSLTRQEFMDECDINLLLARYEKHGTSINGLSNNLPPMYLDFTELPDSLLGYMEFMDKAQDAFMTLPATVRREFDNNAHLFCDFASDPGNLDQMREWGLAPPAKVPDAPKEPVPPPAPAPAPTSSSSS